MLEIDGEIGISGIGRCRRNIGHVLHTVDGLLKRYDDTLLHGFGIRPGIGGCHLDRRRRDVRELLDRQFDKSNKTQQQYRHRDDDRKDRTFYKCLDYHTLALLSVLQFHFRTVLEISHTLGDNHIAGAQT